MIIVFSFLIFFVLFLALLAWLERGEGSIEPTQESGICMDERCYQTHEHPVHEIL